MVAMQTKKINKYTQTHGNIITCEPEKCNKLHSRSVFTTTTFMLQNWKIVYVTEKGHEYSLTTG